MQKVPEAVFKLEYEVARIIADQHKHGVKLDIVVGHLLKFSIEDKLKSINEEVTKAGVVHYLPMEKRDIPPKAQFLKNGELSAAMQKWLGRNNLTASRNTDGKWALGTNGALLPLDSSYAKDWAPLNLGSSDEVKKYLLLQGWVPTMYNRKKDANGRWQNTSAKLFDDSKRLCPGLDRMRNPVVEHIKEYLTLRNRGNVLQSANLESGWLSNRRLSVDGRLCADADTVGAVTGRFTHRIVANVPRSTSVLGKEMRSLFIPSDGKVMVGWDASSLEARMEAHYTYPYDGGAYARELLHGDIHQKNANYLGITRDQAKTFKYAVTYGAQVYKLASTFNWSLDKARAILEEFWKSNPALAQLTEIVKRASTISGYVTTLDKRRIPCGAEYSALNRLLQSSGAIVMKYAMVLAERMIQKEGLDAYGLIRYHDEEQWEAAPEIADRVGELGVQSIVLAGKYLKVKVPLAGEYKIGYNWSETH
jgi:hypothetical protein